MSNIIKTQLQYFYFHNIQLFLLYFVLHGECSWARSHEADPWNKEYTTCSLLKVATPSRLLKQGLNHGFTRLQVHCLDYFVTKPPTRVKRYPLPR